MHTGAVPATAPAAAATTPTATTTQATAQATGAHASSRGGCGPGGGDGVQQRGLGGAAQRPSTATTSGPCTARAT